jgi:Tfp pilus assembly protein PilF
MNPHYSQARVQLGITYFAAGEKKKALEAWKAILKSNPNDESAKMYLKLAEESP